MPNELAVIECIKEVSTEITSACTAIKNVGIISLPVVCNINVKISAARSKMIGRETKALFEENLDLLEEAANYLAGKNFRYESSRRAAEKQLEILNDALTENLQNFCSKYQ